MKILIIKMGSLGDVLRTTFILPGLFEKYAPARVDWLLQESAGKLLLNNPYIVNLFHENNLNKEAYDILINLEDENKYCELASNISAGKKIGTFISNGKIAYTPSDWFNMSLISKYGINRANELKKKNKKTFQQHIAELLGIKIAPYVFDLTKEEIEYGVKIIKDLGISRKDRLVGINTGAGKRWPLKSWGIKKTATLVKKISKELGVLPLILGGEDERERNRIISLETGMPDGGAHSLRHFASIINQCPVILTSDSLAMHFAIALKKRIVAFFGPTPAQEIELYGLGEKLTAPVDCAVCYRKNCDKKPNCMDILSTEEVFAAIKKQVEAL